MSAAPPHLQSQHPVIQASLDATGEQLASQRCLLTFIYALRRFSSVVEIGCGHGGWLYAARRLGATVIRGYDTPDSGTPERGLSPGEFFEADLGEIRMERKFDLAICQEAAARVPPGNAPGLVRSLTGAADWVLFGAALPHQGGLQHLNENWMEYWAAMFADAGFLCYDILRERFWHDTRVAFYYRQGSCLYVRPGAHYALRARGHLPSTHPPSLIHPEMFLKVVGTPASNSDLGAEIRQYYQTTGDTAAGAGKTPLPEKEQK